MIVSDIQSLLKENRSPVIISDRVEHITILSELLGKFFECPILILTGGLGKRARKDVLARVTDYGADGTPFCLFATGSLIGEGFDMPDLDTLLISMPISFRGRLTQYVGRLHRQNNHDTKEIRVYDYVDTCSGMTISMFKKRLTTYRKLGYQPVYTQTDKIAKWIK
ncbi:helicase-related protein [Spirochaeta dissipatitropha]